MRFSSIGDIILTTPIIRALRNKYPEAEIHFLTKKKFESVLKYNPYIHTLHTFEKDIVEIVPLLKSLDFNHIIDLHYNLRSRLLKFKLNRPSSVFPKLNFKKWLLVRFKINQMPPIHIVDRYFDAVAKLDVSKDKEGLDFFLPEMKEDLLLSFGLKKNAYICIAIGAAHFTKQIPISKIKTIIEACHEPVVLLGDRNDAEKAQQIISLFENKEIINACGTCTLYDSAQLIKASKLVITADTGLMHIAAAFHKTIYSFWGNTVPEFGMTPYLPQPENKIFEVKNLSCRPCSKIGYNACPKGHFKCMEEMDVSAFNPSQTKPSIQ